MNFSMRVRCCIKTTFHKTEKRHQLVAILASICQALSFFLCQVDHTDLIRHLCITYEHSPSPGDGNVNTTRMIHHLRCESRVCITRLQRVCWMSLPFNHPSSRPSRITPRMVFQTDVIFECFFFRPYIDAAGNIECKCMRSFFVHFKMFLFTRNKILFLESTLTFLGIRDALGSSCLLTFSPTCKGKSTDQTHDVWFMYLHERNCWMILAARKLRRG